jgi:hypothetical protein
VEDIKQLIIDNLSSDFYLVPSNNPTAMYKILYYVLTPMHPNPSSWLHYFCKVDLLLPGIIGIPGLIPSDVLHYDGMIKEMEVKMKAGEDVPNSLVKIMLQNQNVEELDFLDMMVLCAAFIISGVETVSY